MFTFLVCVVAGYCITRTIMKLVESNARDEIQTRPADDVDRDPFNFKW